jgi:hypothetical protein
MAALSALWIPCAAWEANRRVAVASDGADSIAAGLIRE